MIESGPQNIILWFGPTAYINSVAFYSVHVWLYTQVACAHIFRGIRNTYGQNIPNKSDLSCIKVLRESCPGMDHVFNINCNNKWMIESFRLVLLQATALSECYTANFGRNDAGRQGDAKRYAVCSVCVPASVLAEASCVSSLSTAREPLRHADHKLIQLIISTQWCIQNILSIAVQ